MRKISSLELNFNKGGGGGGLTAELEIRFKSLNENLKMSLQILSKVKKLKKRFQKFDLYDKRVRFVLTDLS